MKKISFIILGVAVISFFTLMSAGEEMSQEQKQQMEQIDQMVKDKVANFKVEKDNECKAKAMNAASAKADSTLKAMDAMKAKSAPAPKTVKKATVKKVTKPATVGNGKPKLGNKDDGSTIGTGKPKLGTPETKDAKKDDGTTIGKGKPKLGGK